jgi:ribosomal protein S18 acetylase RimI-like enzyme
MHLRNIQEADYASVISVIDDWWGGRPMADMLPRLFFIHFQETSFALEHNHQIIGFLIGFVSQSRPTEAYIHFVGVHPDWRQQGLGERLYIHFFHTVRQRGCRLVSCITSPANKGSIAFHTRMGFTPLGDRIEDGIPVKTDYDGRGNSRVVFVKDISAGSR